MNIQEKFRLSHRQKLSIFATIFEKIQKHTILGKIHYCKFTTISKLKYNLKNKYGDLNSISANILKEVAQHYEKLEKYSFCRLARE